MEGLLPDELLVEILIKLPIKSLLRFRCVCKSWYSLINTSSFISSQIGHAKMIHHMNHVMLEEYNNQTGNLIWKLCKDNKSLDEIANVDFPSVNLTRKCSLVIKNSVNGLICLLERFLSRPELETVILWNPLIRRYFNLPMSNIEFDPMNVTWAYGFGYGPSTKDYKVIKITWCYTNTFGLEELGEPVGEVFRVSRGSWQKLEVPASLPWFDDCEQAYVNDCINWLAFHTLHNHIVTFDVDEEAFTKIEVPDALQDVWRDTLTLQTWRGYVSIFEVPRYLADINLWVMKEYGVTTSWTKQLVIKSSGILRSVAMVRSSGKVLLRSTKGSRLLLYDPETNQWDDSGIEVSRVFQLTSSLESLILLNHKEAQSY